MDILIRSEAAQRLSTDGMFEYIRAKRVIKEWSDPTSACSEITLFNEVGGPGVEEGGASVDSMDELDRASASPSKHARG